MIDAIRWNLLMPHPLHPHSRCLAAVLAVLLGLPAAVTSEDFRRDVLPILEKHCFECHRGEDASSGVRLDLRGELLGETTGKAFVVPGDSGRSRLIELVRGG